MKAPDADRRRTADPSCRCNADSLAVASGNLDALKTLVEQGADLAATNAAGLTPLALAEQKNDREAIAYLQRF